jgi:hypothetical protein
MKRRYVMKLAKLRRGTLLVSSGVVVIALSMLCLGSIAYATPISSFSSSSKTLERGSHESVVTHSEKPPAVKIQGSIPPMPGARASIGAWQEWASAQRLAAEHTDVAQELIGQGYRLTSAVYLLPVGEVPGMPIPSGITTYAIAYSYSVAPISHPSFPNDPS